MGLCSAHKNFTSPSLLELTLGKYILSYSGTWYLVLGTVLCARARDPKVDRANLPVK